MPKSLFATLFFIFTLLPLQAQTPAPSPTPAPTYEEMLNKTLAQDIDTASYYELVAWCRLLKLDESGDRQALVTRLKTYFKLESSAETKKIMRRIEINSARSAAYFTLEDIKEDYILIEGGVTLSVFEEKDATRHIIKAERILYNQSLNKISALGNVEYQRQRGDKLEVFTAESFYFDLNSWQGVLFLGLGERQKEIEKQIVLFRYQGETIHRTKDNSIILENSKITSSKDFANPNYKITAQMLVVFAPGEWAVENAVLYLGHLPVLYLPFFYYTSDEIFFNPVFGFRAREGAFWQNTVYLIGKEKREEDIFSFLQLEELGEAGYELKLEGLFLRPVQNRQASSPTSAKSQEAVPVTSKHFKIFLDLYSRLGLFSGLSLDLSPFLKIFGGLAFSRTIFYDPASGSYTPYYPTSGGDSYWNSSNLFGLLVPFRYGLEAEFDFNWGIIQKASGRLYLFSDPYFAKDFYNRSESQDWAGLLGFDLTPTEKPTSPTPTGTGLVREWNNIVWSLNFQLNFSPILKTPLFTNLSLNPLGLSMDWSSRTVANTTSDPVIAFDPGRMFFYPQRLIFPNLGLMANGTLFQFSLTNALTSSKTQETSPLPKQSALVPPQELSSLLEQDYIAAPEVGDTSILPELEKPPLKENLAVSSLITFFNTNESYALNFTLKAEHLFDHANWLKAQDIDYQFSSSLWTHSGQANLNYQFNFWNALVSLQGNTALQEKYRTTYTTETGYSQTNQDKAATSLDLTQYINLTLSPFLTLPDLNQTKISYNLKWDVYDIYYSLNDDTFYQRLFNFSRDTVASQVLQADFVYQPEANPNRLRLSANLPPVLGKFYAELNFFLAIFQTIVILEYNQKTDENWQFSPLRISENVNWENYLSLSTTYKHDLEKNQALSLESSLNLFKYSYLGRERYLLQQQLNYDFSVDSFTKSLTTIDLWDFKTSLLAQWMKPLSPLGTPGSDFEFLIYKLTFNYSLTSGDLYFWKNRLAFNTSFNSLLEFDFQKLVDSKFNLNLQFSLKVYQFLDVIFKVEVYNNNIYRYFPAFVEAVNNDPLVVGIELEPVNFFVDLLKSFNFFNIEDRYDSFFKLKSLALELVHYLDDWVFKVSFNGTFQHQVSGGLQIYTWVPSLTLSLKWLAIPQIERTLKGDASGLQF